MVGTVKLLHSTGLASHPFTVALPTRGEMKKGNSKQNMFDQVKVTTIEVTTRYSSTGIPKSASMAAVCRGGEGGSI